MRTIQTQVFKFAELSKAAQNKAADWFTSSYQDWNDYIFERAVQAGGDIGFDVQGIYYSGFNSQGDGAHFVGSFSYVKGGLKYIKAKYPDDATLISIAEEWHSIQQNNFYSVTGAVKHSGFYQHSGCTSFEVERLGQCANEALEERVKACVRSFMNWIYSMLSKEWEYITTDEYIAEQMAAHGYEFNADGTIYDKHAGKPATIDVECATDIVISRAAQSTDLDRSCRIIQDAIGQTDGGVAGLYFSCLDSAEQWALLTVEERTQHLTAYVEAERERLGFN